MTFIEFTLVSHDVAKSRNSKCAEKRTTNFRHLLRTLKVSIDTCMFTLPKEQGDCKSIFGLVPVIFGKNFPYLEINDISIAMVGASSL